MPFSDRLSGYFGVRCTWPLKHCYPQFSSTIAFRVYNAWPLGGESAAAASHTRDHTAPKVVRS